VYLITGGLGKVGLILAEHLAKTMQARLVLVGRSCPPPPEQWEPWLQGHGEEDATSRKIRRLQGLEKLGSEILVQAADVAEETELKRVLIQAEERFGPIHGIIHAAGVPEAVTIPELTPEHCRKQFRPKVYGLYALAKAVQGRQLDFCYLTSSLSSVLGGLGFGAYAASNIFMDAFAQRQNQQSDFPWISVNWDGWADSVAQSQSGSSNPNPPVAISSEKGARAFEHSLSFDPKAGVIVSVQNLQNRIDKWLRLEALHQQAAPKAGSLLLHPRPAISTPYCAPRNQTERMVASILEDLLGVQAVGIHDNFFELGGHSLLVMQVLKRLAQAFGVQLELTVVLQSPTVAGISQNLQALTCKRTVSASPLVPIKPSGSKAPLFVVHGAQGRAEFLAKFIPHLDRARPLYGFQAPFEAIQAEHAALQEMAKAYIEAMSIIQPTGPYYLSGYSFGGWVAFEMAQQLKRSGHQVAWLGILDTPPFLTMLPMNDGELIAAYCGRNEEERDRISRSCNGATRLSDEELKDLMKQLVLLDRISAKMDVAAVRHYMLRHREREQLLIRYSAQVYEGKLTVFLARVRSKPMERYGTDDWKPYWQTFSSQPLEVHRVPGEHETIALEPHVRHLVKKINVSLAKATVMPVP
jgi:thioesterase domain-containing protein/NAD(P)-dependent dehydrogenase (short-subunit alcohol dehydrogenase family)/acyl carrier protein